MATLWPRFSGAASVRMRKYGTTLPVSSFTVEPQWGRIREDAEVGDDGVQESPDFVLQWGRIREDAEVLDTDFLVITI